MTTNTQTTNEALLARRKAVLPTGLGIAFPIFAERAKNSEIWDVEGKRYIDFIGGITVVVGDDDDNSDLVAVLNSNSFDD